MKQNRLYVISTTFLLFCVLLISQTKVISHPSQPDAGYVNDPDPSGALTCANSQCHSGSPVADSVKFTVKMGLFSAGTTAQTDIISESTTYFADSVYYITVTGNTTALRYGFELTIIDASASPGNMAGVIALTNTTNTTIGTYQPTGSTIRQYAGHKNAGTNHSWTFKWTAPHTGKGPLTIYYVGMNSNNNGNTSGDLVYNATKVIAEASVVSGLENLNNELNSLAIYPTVFANELNFSFSPEENTKAKVELIAMNGSIVSELMNEEVSSGLFNRSFNTTAITAGIYLVRLQTGNSSTVRKIVKP